MKWAVAFVAVVIGLALVVQTSLAGTASCGDYKNYTKLRAKNTTCSVARKVAHAEWVYPHGIGAKHTVLGSWTCQALVRGRQYHQRCTRGLAVVTFDGA
jgi:hypothetical protein